MLVLLLGDIPLCTSGSNWHRLLLFFHMSTYLAQVSQIQGSSSMPSGQVTSNQKRHHKRNPLSVPDSREPACAKLPCTDRHRVTTRVETGAVGRANWRRPTYAGRWVGWMVRTLVDWHQPIGYSPLLCQLDKIDRRSTENSWNRTGGTNVTGDPTQNALSSSSSIQYVTMMISPGTSFHPLFRIIPKCNFWQRFIFWSNGIGVHNILFLHQR